jgi:hypothetical protein
MQRAFPDHNELHRDKSGLIAFVHIPKTAGTTLNSVLALEYALNERHEIMMRGMSWILPRPEIIRRPLISFSKIRRLKASVRSRRDLRLVHGHFDLSMMKHLPYDTRYFTLLRDPVERAISHYYHFRRRPAERLHPLAVQSTLAEWVGSCGLVEMDNGQTRRLAGEMNLPCGRVTRHMLERAKSNLAEFAVVGLTERFDESLTLLARAFGWCPHPYVAQNVGANRPPRSELSRETVEAIERCNRFDLELYRCAADRFESAVGGIPAEGRAAAAG